MGAWLMKGTSWMSARSLAGYFVRPGSRVLRTRESNPYFAYAIASKMGRGRSLTGLRIKIINHHNVRNFQKINSAV